jgi:hypothetical protein
MGVRTNDTDIETKNMARAGRAFHSVKEKRIQLQIQKAIYVADRRTRQSGALGTVGEINQSIKDHEGGWTHCGSSTDMGGRHAVCWPSRIGVLCLVQLPLEFEPLLAQFEELHAVAGRPLQRFRVIGRGRRQR